MKKLVTPMKSFGNLILMTTICLVIFWVIMALRPAHAAEPKSDDAIGECGKFENGLPCWLVERCMQQVGSSDWKLNGKQVTDFDRCVYDNEQPHPKPAAFRRWQMAWQCNDLRVTVTGQADGVINYDIAGTVWGGINFTQTFSLREGSRLFLRGVPCVPLR